MNQGLISVLGIMAISVFAVWLFKRVNLPAILAYLFAGVLAGPELLQLIQDSEQIHLVAEIGIVFLLFSLGLEFSLPKLIAMRNMVFGLGIGQMTVTTGVVSLVAVILGVNIVTAIIMGAMVALSSTAIVIKQIDEMGKLNTLRSQMAVSILLFQDIAVVPLLIVIPLLAIDDQQSIWLVMLLAILKGTLVVTVLLSFGRWLLPRIFNEIARVKTDELFVLTTIFTALLAAAVTYAFGLSMALGAFLAGMMLSESQYRHQLESDIRPFRDILMGLFFITVGMKLQLDVFSHYFMYILIGCIAVVVIKTIIIRLVSIAIKSPSQDAWAAGLKLSQMGEFSFVIAALALENSVISTTQSSILISIGVMSMAITPWLINISHLFAQKMAPNTNTKDLNEANDTLIDDDISDHVIIIGFGRVGQSVARLLKLEGLSYKAIDIDAIRVKESRQAGERVIFGDGHSRDLLRLMGIEKAKLVLITFDDHYKALKVTKTIKSLSHDIDIVVRTRKDHMVDDFYQEGASQVVPEVQEGSLMLVSQVLHYAGIPMSRILKRVRNERKRGYQHMHGFFPGESTELSYQTKDKLEFMHAVVITANAFAVGKSLASFNLLKRKIRVTGIRRDGKEIEYPQVQTVIKENDVLIISGKPRRVERMENYLLNGN